MTRRYGGRGQRRQRIRMGLPPQPPYQEAPLEELAARHRQALQVATRADHRHHAGAFLPDLHDAQLMAQGAPDREAQAADQDGARRAGPQHDPERPGEGMTHEGRPVGQLMGEGQRHGQIGVQVDGPPGLVAQPAPDRPEGHDARRDQQPQRYGGPQHVGIGGQQGPELVQDAGAVGPGVAGRDEQGVEGEQHDRPGAQLAVPAHQSVLAQRPLQARNAGDEQEHEEQQVGPRQTRETTGVGQPAAGSLDGAARLTGKGQPHHHQEAQSGQRRGDLRHPPRRRGGRPAGRVAHAPHDRRQT